MRSSTRILQRRKLLSTVGARDGAICPTHPQVGDQRKDKLQRDGTHQEGDRLLRHTRIERRVCDEVGVVRAQEIVRDDGR